MTTTPPSDQPALAIGSLFAGDYEIVRPLSEGGMGAVYVARQLSTEKLRALKIMHEAIAVDPELRKRFELEARIGSRINSDHVVEVIGSGVDAATQIPFLAMELLEGEDLSAAIARRGPLPFEEVREILGQLCHAVGEAHAHGVVHRDLKPENVFLAAPRHRGVAFTVKVLDFGIARVMAEAKIGIVVKTQGTLGTPLWMAPEQAKALTIVPATDVWAIGLIAFRALTGRMYWSSGQGPSVSLVRLIEEVCVKPIVPASARAAEIGAPPGLLPPGFDAWFARSVTRDPADRYVDAAAQFAGLEQATGGRVTVRPAVDTRASSAAPPPAPSAPSSLAITASASPVREAILAATRQQEALLPKPKKALVWPWVLLGLLAVGAIVGVGVVFGPALIAQPHPRPPTHASRFAGSWSGRWTDSAIRQAGTMTWVVAQDGAITGTARNETHKTQAAVRGHVMSTGALTYAFTLAGAPVSGKGQCSLGRSRMTCNVTEYDAQGHVLGTHAIELGSAG